MRVGTGGGNLEYRHPLVNRILNIKNIEKLWMFKNPELFVIITVIMVKNRLVNNTIKIVGALVIMVAGLACSALDIHASGLIDSNAGIASLMDQRKSEDEYKDAAANYNNYGYKNIGIAQVEGHLNIRAEADIGGKLVGKMTNNAACEILDVTGEWAHIKSGEVEGYAHTDYMLMGVPAMAKAREIATVQAKSTESGLRVRTEPNTDCEILTTMGAGETLPVVEVLDGWIKVLVDDEEGYISDEYAKIEEELSTACTMTELLYGEGVSDVRVELCQFAKQYIGNRYVWGGASLTKGTDCSGFTMTVLGKYGIKLPHSAASQSTMGTAVTLAQARPGDLVFYAKGSRVNHVAIYIGNGQVVHASNPREGIKISSVGYRTIHNIRRFIQD